MVSTKNAAKVTLSLPIIMIKRSKDVFGCFMQLVFFGMGLFQWYAVICFATDVLGWGILASGLVFALLAFFPFIGSVAGMIAAIYAWHWPWWIAFPVFFWYLILAFVMATYEKFKR